MAKKKKTSDIVRCYDCKYAYLMQEKQNPVIALCKQTIDRKNNATREVARQQRICEKYAKGYPAPHINPMIPIQ